jgi:hypothetical protein
MGHRDLPAVLREFGITVNRAVPLRGLPVPSSNLRNLSCRIGVAPRGENTVAENRPSLKEIRSDPVHVARQTDERDTDAGETSCAANRAV